MLRFKLLLLLLRQWRRRLRHQNPNQLKTKKNLRFNDLLSQNQLSDRRLASQNPESSSRGSRNRRGYPTGYPNLFDRLTPKR